MPREQSMMTQDLHGDMRQGGHLYMQTNEIRNAVIHYLRSPNGTITEAERCLTGGAGSGTFKPVSGQESAPNDFEGARSVILTTDRRFLFATNGGRVFRTTARRAWRDSDSARCRRKMQG